MAFPTVAQVSDLSLASSLAAVAQWTSVPQIAADTWAAGFGLPGGILGDTHPRSAGELTQTEHADFQQPQAN